MASTVTRMLKRSNPVTTSNTAHKQPPGICYLTKGTAADEWHIWNTSQVTLTVQPGDCLQVYIVESNFECRTLYPISILSDFVVAAMTSSPCTLD